MKLLKVNKQTNLIEEVSKGEVIIKSISKPREYNGTNILDLEILNEGIYEPLSVKADTHSELKVGPAFLIQTKWKANEKLGYKATTTSKISNL